MTVPKIEIFWRISLVAATLFAVIMATLPNPPITVGSSDKIQHMLAFAVLTALACLAYPRANALYVIFGLGFIGAVIELIQSIPALRRDANLADWLADLFAIIIVICAARLLKIAKRNESSPTDRD